MTVARSWCHPLKENMCQNHWHPGRVKKWLSVSWQQIPGLGFEPRPLGCSQQRGNLGYHPHLRWVNTKLCHWPPGPSSGTQGRWIQSRRVHWTRWCLGSAEHVRGQQRDGTQPRGDFSSWKRKRVLFSFWWFLLLVLVGLFLFFSISFLILLYKRRLKSRFLCVNFPTFVMRAGASHGTELAVLWLLARIVSSDLETSCLNELVL